MTTSERVHNLQIGDKVAITLNNSTHEVLTGRVHSRTIHSLRLETADHVVGISTAPGFIARVRRVA
jgi:hypothetical protein